MPPQAVEEELEEEEEEELEEEKNYIFKINNKQLIHSCTAKLKKKIFILNQIMSRHML